MKKNILITGGAGFIGINAASHFIKKGAKVTIIDNLCRSGAAKNLSWLKRNHSAFRFSKTDVTDYKKLRQEVEKAGNLDAVLHLAGQVAVTSSISNPREDFLINALGTFNMLEAVREIYALSSSRKKKSPLFLLSSTNKVYGSMEDVPVEQANGRYRYKNMRHGIAETAPLDFHSPYGCSKGTADQYVRDYARIYNLNSTIFRQSCIYGYRQFGVEDQGWVAWFIIAAQLKKQITIYGDGKQVRDILFIEDLVNSYHLAIKNRAKVAGQVYNIGGGTKNAISLLQLISKIEKLSGKKLQLKFDRCRAGDQPIFIADIRKAKKEFGWQPAVGATVGIEKLYRWVAGNKQLFKKF